jgi:predicted MFS family arabinose efflux permease
MYCPAGALIGAGYADFALVAYHFGEVRVVAPAFIPVLYAVAMLAAGAAALVLGRLLDCYGIVVVLGASLVAAVAVPLVFVGGFSAAIGGVVLWGIGMGAQDSVLKAALADFLPAGRRATGYGTYDMLRGVAWLLGSLLLGFFYDRSVVAVVVVSLALQVMAAPVLLAAMRQRKKAGGN